MFSRTPQGGLAAEAAIAFGDDLAADPSMSLRAGNALDEYREAPPFDARLDAATPAYLEAHYWGMAHLDPLSWRHYLPHFIRYAEEHWNEPDAMAIDALLASLRPPDRDPPRLGSLSEAQAQVVGRLLDGLAFGDGSAWSEPAMQLLEEYWGPGALYRTGP